MRFTVATTSVSSVIADHVVVSARHRPGAGAVADIFAVLAPRPARRKRCSPAGRASTSGRHACSSSTTTSPAATAPASSGRRIPEARRDRCDQPHQGELDPEVASSAARNSRRCAARPSPARATHAWCRRRGRLWARRRRPDAGCACTSQSGSVGGKARFSTAADLLALTKAELLLMRCIQVVFQNPYLVSNLRFFGLIGQDAGRADDDLMASVHRRGAARAPPRRWSRSGSTRAVRTSNSTGRPRQRVASARCLTLDLEVLVLDEASALDVLGPGRCATCSAISVTSRPVLHLHRRPRRRGSSRPTKRVVMATARSSRPTSSRSRAAGQQDYTRRLLDAILRGYVAVGACAAGPGGSRLARRDAARAPVPHRGGEGADADARSSTNNAAARCSASGLTCSTKRQLGDLVLRGISRRVGHRHVQAAAGSTRQDDGECAGSIPPRNSSGLERSHQAGARPRPARPGSTSRSGAPEGASLARRAACARQRIDSAIRPVGHGGFLSRVRQHGVIPRGASSRSYLSRRHLGDKAGRQHLLS